MRKNGLWYAALANPVNNSAPLLNMTTKPLVAQGMRRR